VRSRGTHASTSVEEFQAYDPSKINDNVRKAVESTKGKVAKFKGQYINAWFHSSGGPKTAASAEEGLGYRQEPTPYIQSVPDPGLAITLPENKNWTAPFSKAELRAAVRRVTGEDPGPVGEVKIVSRGPSGRVTQLKVGNKVVEGPALRLALGSDRLRSTLTTDIKIKGDRVIFRGQGYGHGVGLSQWGAKALAQQGKSPEEIVKYFFKKVDIVKAW